MTDRDLGFIYLHVLLGIAIGATVVYVLYEAGRDPVREGATP